MAGNSKIEWTDATWNPVVGCTPISKGCENCWARVFARRFGFPEKITLYPDRIEEPLHWRKPRRIFVCSMSDLFHKDVPFEFIDKMFEVILFGAPQHRYLILTKRPRRAKEYFVDGHRGNCAKVVWFGVSIENQRRADERIPTLIQIPAAVRFVSFEPLLESINVSPHLECRWQDIQSGFLSVECAPTIDELFEQSGFGAIDTHLPLKGKLATCNIRWAIIGCESINGRPGRFADGFADAAIDLVRQCKEAGVKVFVKQVPLGNKVSHNPAEWPEELRVQEYPQRTRL